MVKSPTAHVVSQQQEEEEEADEEERRRRRRGRRRGRRREEETKEGEEEKGRRIESGRKFDRSQRRRVGDEEGRKEGRKTRSSGSIAMQLHLPCLVAACSIFFFLFFPVFASSSLSFPLDTPSAGGFSQRSSLPLFFFFRRCSSFPTRRSFFSARSLLWPSICSPLRSILLAFGKTHAFDPNQEAEHSLFRKSVF
jgi:hypothetical protein